MYKLELNFPRVDYQKMGHSNGFTLTRFYDNTSGNKKIKVGDIVKVKLRLETPRSCRYVVLEDQLPAGLVAINSAIKTEEGAYGAEEKKQEADWWYWNEDGSYSFVPNYVELRNDRVMAYKDELWSWNNIFEYTYYARAVCSGDFTAPSAKVELMYTPEVCAYTPSEKLVIEGK
jgi:uncharacterized protein YfaS (alpha-2-macroglobulin family)